jgi:putative transposase
MSAFRRQPRPGGRRTIRFQAHDYAAAGAYFITICTPFRYNYLAHLTPSGIRLTRAGWIVARCWDELPAHFPDILIDTFVVMPDHVHGIVMIAKSTGWRDPGAAAVCPGSLGAIVRSFKSAATRQVRLIRPGHPPLWQRNYYERILRDERAMDTVRRYIINNPAKLFDRVIRAGGRSWHTRDGVTRPG